MPSLDAIKDPTTGKIKPVVLIAGGGIGLVALFLIAGSKGGSSGGQSGGQELDDALGGLVGGDIPEAPGGGGDSNVPNDTSLPPSSNPTNPDSATYYPDNSYPAAAGYSYEDPPSYTSEPLVPAIVSAIKPRTTSGQNSATKADALAAIKARAIAAGFTGSNASVLQTYNNNIAEGQTLEHIARPTSTGSANSVSGPSAVELNAIKARAKAAGLNPTAAQILATYNRWHSG